MSLFYRSVYRISLTPWERMQAIPAGRQASALIDREQDGTGPPYGRRWIWAVEPGSGRSILPGADGRSRESRSYRKPSAVPGSGHGTPVWTSGSCRVTSPLSAPPVSVPGFRLALDFGVVHGLSPEHRAAAGQEVTAVTAPGATLLMYAMAPGRRGPLPRGMDRRGVKLAYPGWTIVDEEAFDVSGTPREMRKASPRWYRLRRD